jgi:drug/metabolite transporter (DMT)-like permease
MGFAYVFFSSLRSIVKKKINMDVMHIQLISSFVGCLIFSMIVYYKYKNSPKEFKKKKNPYNLSDNPFENILSIPSLKIGLSGSLMSFLTLFTLKKLPFSFVVPIGLSWLFFALFFNKIMRNIPITMDKIISILIVIFGVFVMQYHHFFHKTMGKDTIKNLLLLSSLLIISKILKAYQVTLIKEIEEYTNYNEVVIMDWGMLLILSVVFYFIYLFSPIKNWVVNIPKTKDVFKLILLNSVLITLYVTFRFKSLQNLPESTYALITSTKVIFAFIFGFLFFGEKITMNQIIGSMIIMFGIYYKNLMVDLHNKFFYDTGKHV